MGAAPVRFEGVWKRFRKGESATALRDLLPSLVRSLRGRARIRDSRDFWAIRDLSFEVREGEVLGLIGPNGAGKSTTLKLVAGLLRPNRGSVRVDGTLSALIEVAAGFHPDLTGRENIFLNGSVLGLRNRVIRERLDEIIDFAELREFIDTPVKRYSTGMYMRLGFAVAVHVDPRILLIDEVLAVGDLAFRRKCLRRIRRLKESGKTILFVSHKMFDVRSICDRVIQVEGGEARREGSALEVTKEYEREMLKKSLGEITGQPLSQRAGRGAPVRITRVRVLGVSGEERLRFRTGEGARIRVAVTAAEPVERPVLSVSLVRSDSLRACTASTLLLGPEIPRLEGEVEFEVLFERLDLIEDYYTVETVIWPPDMAVPLAQHLNPTFLVEEEGCRLNRAGVFHPPARFAVLGRRGGSDPRG